MPLQDRAVNVLEILLGIPGLTDGPVIFIRHSLGGPIVKQILLDLDRQKGRRPEATGFLNRVTRVVFLANPHTGSRKGSLLWPTSRADGRTHRHPADVIVDEASADPGLTGLPPIPVDDPGLETAENLANIRLDVSRPRSIKIQFECELVHTSPCRIGFLSFVALSIPDSVHG